MQYRAADNPPIVAEILYSPVRRVPTKPRFEDIVAAVAVAEAGVVALKVMFGG